MLIWLVVRLQYSWTCELNVVYRHALCKSYKYFNGHYSLSLCRLPTLILAPNILNILEYITTYSSMSSDVKNVHAVSSKTNKIYILQILMTSQCGQVIKIKKKSYTLKINYTLYFSLTH